MSDTMSIYLRGLILMVGYLVIAFMVSVIEGGAFGVVHFAKTFLMFDGGILIGWLFTWLWGWPVWWASILLVISWLGSLFFIVTPWAENKEKKLKEKNDARLRALRELYNATRDEHVDYAGRTRYSRDMSDSVRYAMEEARIAMKED